MSGHEFDNVTPMQPRRPSDRVRRILDRIEMAHELRPVLDRDYVVKGWLDRGATSVLLGAPNAAKTFLAIDLAHHVHEGLPWSGCRVQPGAVLYVAAEGGAMFDNRLVARKARFLVLRGALTLPGQNGDARPLAEAVLELAELHGEFRLIIIDTLARVMGTADENAAPDIAALVRSAELLRDRTGAHVMLIHHTGKDASRGARGHSSLLGAIDTEILIEKGEDGVRLARATKQRDMQGGAEIEFTLKEVVLGRDADGDPVTSCIIETKGGQRQANFGF